MGQPQPDQRRSFRFSATFRLEASGSESNPRETHALRDISTMGIRMSSPESLPVGQIVEIRFPDIDEEFIAQGTVVWCEPRENAPYEIGLQFDENSEHYEQLCTRIREIEKYRQTVEDLRGRALPPADAAREWITKFGSSI